MNWALETLFSIAWGAFKSVAYFGGFVVGCLMLVDNVFRF